MDQAKAVVAPVARRLPIGAEVLRTGGTHFRVWAPRCQRVELCVTGGRNPLTVEMAREREGYFSCLATSVGVGDRYGFRLDRGDRIYPDPASRRQPEGPHESSEVVDPTAYTWRDGDWIGPTLQGQIIYELHIGTFTSQGTWKAATAELARIAELGVKLIEMMPVAEFAGNFGWGYDGVDLFAPSHLYGTPDDLRRFVDEAHSLGLGVILDVVYNHFGPSGNYLSQFSTSYQSTRHHTDWGDGINFDGENNAAVREFFTSNAGYWIDEFHFDGLRLDAVHSIVDDSHDHILAAIARRAHDAAHGRRSLVFAENERQESKLIRPVEVGGYGLDACWNDDFHHSARVATTGHREGYFSDFQGTPQELIAAAKWGHLYQGQWIERQQRFRGTPSLDIESARFVVFLQNHDQIANSPLGKRIHALTSPGRHRAVTALLLLSPGTPMLFQGQEFSASAPFHYFADHEEELGRLVSEGRRQELVKFRWLSGADAEDAFSDPCDRGTFEISKLDHHERESHDESFALHQDLIRLRRKDPVFAAQQAVNIHGSVVGPEAFLLRFMDDENGDRLLVVNLGPDVDLRSVADPLIAPPADTTWQIIWSSENPRYGGAGTGQYDAKAWYIPGHSAMVLSACADAGE